MYKVAGSVLSKVIPYIFETKLLLDLNVKELVEKKSSRIDPNISHIRRQNAYYF